MNPASHRRGDLDVLTWPNVVTLLRLPLAAAFVLVDSVAVRVAILGLAAASDWLDGWLARTSGRASRAGELLDPLADKIFVVAALATFKLAGTIALWELVILVSRDLFATLSFAVASLRRWPIRFRSRPSGKVVTALQIIAVLGLLLRSDAATALVFLVGLGSAVAILDYGLAGLRALRRAEHTA